MLYQQGPHMGSNMGTRMHSYPLYQDLQQKAEPLAEVLCRRLVPGLGQRRQPDRAGRGRDGVGQLLLDARRASRRSGRVFNSQEDDQVYQGHPVVGPQLRLLGQPLRARSRRHRQEDPASTTTR